MTVPLYPGVPPLPFGVGVVAPPVTLMTADDPSALAQAAPTIWGIFDSNNAPVITGNSVRAFTFLNEQRISDYPVESGGFVSYNKVATPFDARLTFVQGGSISDKTAFLSDLKSRLDDVELYSVVTPEFQYDNANIVHIDYRRTSREGVTLLTIDVWVREVRVIGLVQFSNTAQPDAAAKVNDGTVAPNNPTTQVDTPATDTQPGNIQATIPSNIPINPPSGQFFANPSTETTPLSGYGPLPPNGDTSKLPGFTPIM